MIMELILKSLKRRKSFIVIELFFMSRDERAGKYDLPPFTVMFSSIWLHYTSVDLIILSSKECLGFRLPNYTLNV